VRGTARSALGTARSAYRARNAARLGLRKLFEGTYRTAGAKE
jgi:uncharacterized protein HemY